LAKPGLTTSVGVAPQSPRSNVVISVVITGHEASTLENKDLDREYIPHDRKLTQTSITNARKLAII
jgi:hypothetical protein